MFGHYNIYNTHKRIQTSGVDLCPIITSKHHGGATCTVPLYRACLNRKGGRTLLQSNNTTINYEYIYVIEEEDLLL